MRMTYMKLGTAYDAFLSDTKFANGGLPILNSKGGEPGSFGDTSVRLSPESQNMFTTEVATSAAVNANGKYFIDYNTGQFRGQPADSGYALMFWQTKLISQSVEA